MPQRRTADAVAAGDRPCAGAGFKVVAEYDGSALRGCLRRVRDRRQVADVVPYFEGKKVVRLRLEALNRIGLDGSRRAGHRGNHGCGRIEVTLVDRRLGVAQVVGRRLTCHTVVTGGAPAEGQRERAGVDHERSVTAAGGMVSFSKAAATFSRPPVTVMPCMDGTGSAELMRRSFTWWCVMPGNCANTSAAAPETCGVAIEVPLSSLYPDGSEQQVLPTIGTEERMPTPGAPRSTVVAP